MTDTTKQVAGIKFDSDKLRYSLLPPGTIKQVTEVLEFGARKYAPDNWKHVPDARARYYDAAHRHIESWWSGQTCDQETSKHHLAHAVCCLLFLIWLDGDVEPEAAAQSPTPSLDLAATLREREGFESQMRAEGVENFARRPSGRYDNMVLEWHWLGWRGRARAGDPT